MSQSAADRFKDGDTLSRMPRLLTVREFARVLRVNRNTAYEAIQRGDVPGVVRIGNSIRICRKTVVEWLRGQDRGTRSSKG